MALGPRLDLRQGQQLVMTPQLQQAIKLLQLNNLELVDYLNAELERNPLLETDDERPQNERAAEEDSRDELMSGAAESDNDYDYDLEVTADRALEADPAREGDADGGLDADYSDNVFNNDSPADLPYDGGQTSLNGAGAINGGGGHDDLSNFEDNLTGELGLRDHLLEQLHLAVSDPADLLIGSHLIDMVDDAGYISEPLDETPERLGCSREELERVLGVLQRFDPSGVCARSLSECLKIQQRERDRLDPAMDALLDNLPLVVRQDFVVLKRVCGVDQADILDMISEIQQLNPKPGLAFGGGLAQTVVPDVFVRKDASGNWHVELNSAVLPRVLVNQRYYTELSDRGGGKAEKTFISECMQSANWLMKALDQRARTILKVSAELVKQQEEFFEHGVRFLRPLNLRHIAEAIDMHESTVSRVTNNKYMATPRGIFELRYFFTTAIPSAAGAEDAHSSEAVRDRIRELIDQEKPAKILSDDKIVEILRAEQIDIARRTVAKYRESMRIPSSVQRRRLKRLNA